LQGERKTEAYLNLMETNIIWEYMELIFQSTHEGISSKIWGYRSSVGEISLLLG
jgi:hypothetical protein